uniref:Myb/SANT-like domain-containing protein n=1 Tax=Oryza punctata TaxID=4537 RepID=A0A0E0MNB0_ORYPU
MQYGWQQCGLEAPGVGEMLRYYKEKIQAEGRQFIFKEAHHEECAKKINEKYHTNFTSRQVYHKFNKFKVQWKVIMEAKDLSGANFDDVEKRILYDDTEVVRMNNAKDKREKYINVPICWYDEMEFIFQDKHAIGEFTVLQAPYDHPMTEDTDFIGEKYGSPSDVNFSLHYDSDRLPEENNNRSSSSSKCPKGTKTDKGKRIKADDNPILHITGAMNNMSDTIRFRHVTHPNESLFKIIDEMVEYPTIVRLQLQTYLATHKIIAAMLKGRPLDAIKEYVA